jgi:cation:H+ antiporter
MVVLVGLYLVYIGFALRAPHVEEERIGVPGYLVDRPNRLRVPLVVAMFLFSAGTILVAVEPFAHGLEALGPRVGLSSFFTIQWIAPLASESPELVITAYLVHKARSTAAFNALISSKLNQWTLLIGTLVVVYSVALGSYGALPLDPRQAGEIWLTAAQSFFALALLMNFWISGREAAALLLLFAVQLLPRFHHHDALIGFSLLYVALGLILVVARRGAVPALIDDLRDRTT